MCSVSHKVVIKIMASRMTQIMKKLVLVNQCSFVHGRISVDNILVVQDVVHSMRNKTGKVGFMAIKVDLKKAYDRLDSSFIIDTLKDIGLPLNLIDLVWHCISLATMQLLWNDSSIDRFSFSRGVQQGDPISPYLFVLCIEKLS